MGGVIERLGLPPLRAAVEVNGADEAGAFIVARLLLDLAGVVDSREFCPSKLLSELLEAAYGWL
ncbi:hypothetical protein U1701_18135 [Sphingomonas sp. PB2P19]|uniref:hypothetical protein n=1 Tax=Sphingomonas rhamnosi TaxID=3096156 RepID=UPI002FC5F885